MNAKQMLHWYRDAASATVLLLIFAYTLYGAKDIKTLIAASVDAKFYPVVISITGILLCAINLVKGIKSGNELKKGDLAAGLPKEEIDPNKRIGDTKIILSIVSIIVYLALIQVLGFVPSSVLYLIAQIYLLTDQKKPKLIMVVIVSVAASVITYLLFPNIFYLMLPQGIMPF
jgi:hypothetical protein